MAERKKIEDFDLKAQAVNDDLLLLSDSENDNETKSVKREDVIIRIGDYDEKTSLILADDIFLIYSDADSAYKYVTGKTILDAIGLGSVGLLTGSSALTGTEIDWLLEPVRTKTMASDTSFTFSNLVINKAITLILDGNYTPSFPASGKVVSGSYDGSGTNYVQLLCVANDVVLISYNQEL